MVKLNESYKRNLEENFGQGSDANARFGNPNVQKLLSQMTPDEEVHTRSWSEGSTSGSFIPIPIKEKSAESVAGEGTKDRFVPSQQDLIKSVAASDGSSNSSSSSSHRSSVKGGDNSSSSSTRSSREGSRDKQRADGDGSDSGGEGGALSKEANHFIVGLGILCFLIGAILITYIYSPLNEQEPDKAGKNGKTVASGTASPGLDGAKSWSGGGAALDSGNSGGLEVIETNRSNLDEYRGQPGTIKVYVVGAVKKPGMVSLPFESRVNDAIEAAGGMTQDADPLRVNLAKRVKDEDKIFVASKNGTEADSDVNLTETRIVSSSGVVDRGYSEVVPPRGGRRAGRSAKRASAANGGSADGVGVGSAGGNGEVQSGGGAASGENAAQEAGGVEFTLNLNLATEEEMQRVPGIGPSISKSIVDFRSSLPDGKFTSKEQLKQVIGVGEANYARFEPYFVL
ncbi:MAG: helix-hairpin-helix domain-containing protein [bacterium]|nr:helix-hairpin-helix domain-containing protein [bacterium]